MKDLHQYILLSPKLEKFKNKQDELTEDQIKDLDGTEFYFKANLYKPGDLIEEGVYLVGNKDEVLALIQPYLTHSLVRYKEALYEVERTTS